jgi:hypothetical protein
MCFVWISEQTAIISLYSINWLVFMTETESVYCAVRAETLRAIQIRSVLLLTSRCNHCQRKQRVAGSDAVFCGFCSEDIYTESRLCRGLFLQVSWFSLAKYQDSYQI